MTPAPSLGVLQLPWYWEWALRIQRRFQTPLEQYAATAVVVALFALLLAVLFVAGRRARDRFGADAVRTFQWLTVTVAALVSTAFLVGLWRVTSEVESAFAFVAIGPSDAIRALVTFIVFAAAYTTTLLTKRSIGYGTGRSVVSEHQREIAHHLVQVIVFVPAAGFVVALWGIPVRSLFLGAGALGIVVGFAARKTLSGALSGFVILLARPFEVGDWIAVGDREGIVTDITLYNTQIRTFNEEHVLVPNDEVTGNEVVNFTKTERLRLTTDVGIDYDADIATAARVATEAMNGCDAVIETPSPDVVRHRFDDSAVVLRLRYWIQPPTVQRKWKAQNAVIEAVKTSFEREGIGMPFPQRELSQRTGVDAAESDDTGSRVATPPSDPAAPTDDRSAGTADRTQGEGPT